MNIIEKLTYLSEKYKDIILYPNANTKLVFSGIGRVPGNFPRELLELLKHTNGASILDYCFLGFKNRKLGIDIDKYVLELWGANDYLAGKVIGFVINSSGDAFGYLINSKYKTLSFDTPIVYYSNQNPHELYVIGTSFNRFMNTFLDDVEFTIMNSSNELLLDVEIINWPQDVNHWISKDPNLLKLYEELGLNKNGLLILE